MAFEKKKIIFPQPPASANASWNQLLILRGSERFEAICSGLYDCFETLLSASNRKNCIYRW